jgi:hypothetical protein
MSPMGSKWVKRFMWAQFGLIPPPDDDGDAAWADDFFPT